MDEVKLEIESLRNMAIGVLSKIFETGCWNPTLENTSKILRTIACCLKTEHIKPEMILSVRNVETNDGKLRIRWSYDESTLLKLVEYFSTL